MWRLKVFIQFLLAHMPGGEKMNYLLQYMIGTHSPGKKTKRVIEMIKRIQFISRHTPIEGKIIVEIGTGWNAIGAVLFYLMGARTCYTYDHVPHARFKLIRQLVGVIENQLEEIQSIVSIPAPVLQERLSKLKTATSLQELFSRANIIYFAPGDASKTGLPGKSVDVVFSYAVLEHVPEEVIHALTVESKRILKEEGIAYHLIGLHDHYVKFSKKISKVNFLKYPEKWWTFWVKNKISYHNRLREKQFIDIFKSHGAKIKSTRNETEASDIEILKGMKIDKQFAGMTDEELAVFKTEIILSF
jgi:SAM-dependent methyltransferase